MLDSRDISRGTEQVSTLGARPSVVTTTTTTVVTTTTNASNASLLETTAPSSTTQPTVASEPHVPSSRISRPTTPVQVSVQPSTSASTSSTQQQLVAQQRVEIDDSDDDNSVVSVNNPRRCQLCGKRDTPVHKQACNERKRESLSARFKQKQCSIWIIDVEFTPCGHILQTACYNRNRVLGVMPDNCQLVREEFRSYINCITRRVQPYSSIKFPFFSSLSHFSFNRPLFSASKYE